ncbi:hypothetical protein [Actibacterium sp. 188UL27-1]|uniref:hypothetical protein n=1 Tax=Actibacterium sp. 188UL27-1 TaxID=2786961 RepID=UPI0019568B86|nr:hypothetical protein [Actibacterium sp. 188UL27-1]MBM7070263.1 hypothetical protein [Actibacterium sp. 188UL27-1]
MGVVIKGVVVVAWSVAAALTGRLAWMMATGNDATLDRIFALAFAIICVWCVRSGLREVLRRPQPIVEPTVKPVPASFAELSFAPGVFGAEDLAQVARAVTALETAGALQPGELTAEAICMKLSAEGQDGPFDPYMILVGMALIADDSHAPFSGIHFMPNQVEMDKALITDCVLGLFRVAGRPIVAGDVAMDLPEQNAKPFDIVITLDDATRRTRCTFFWKYLPENLLFEVLILADESGPNSLRQADIDQWVAVAAISESGKPGVDAALPKMFI